MYQKLLKLYKHPFTLIRLGRNQDGGYIVPKELLCNKLISCGINNEISFENDYIKQINDCRIYSYDGTILEFPSENKNNFIWEKLNIGKNDTKTTISLNTIFKKFDIEKCGMKMDIEGAEYEVFSNIIDENINKLEFLIIELHNLKKDKLKFETLMNKLTNHFVLIHKHDNTCGCFFHYNNICYADVIELTFVHKKYINNLIENNIDLPIEGLDYLNSIFPIQYID